ncbi:MAG: thioredoxin-disulfide reductase [Spirochaetia bacterium]|jgi:thioredoxin reductase (NADPH)|nr:thioredoxin-disulfide reductase [Spirochaetia bacterium]
MKQTDIAIIGGGPGGLAAAQYGARAGRDVLIIEKLAAGGQTMLIDRIENYPGFDEAITGFELADKMQRQAENFGAKLLYDELVSIKKDDKYFEVNLKSETVQAKTVIIATGAKHRVLDIDGEATYSGKGVSYCGTCDGPFFRNKTIYVIGGGDTALTDALYLSKLSDDVTLVHRRDRFRAQDNLVRQISASKIKTMMNFKPVSIKGDGTKVTAIELESTVDGQHVTKPTSAVFIFAGMLPQTEMLDKELLDKTGYVMTNDRMETKMPGLFAIGDVRNTPFRQVVTAAADGAVAAHIASEYIDEIEGNAYASH